MSAQEISGNKIYFKFLEIREQPLSLTGGGAGIKMIFLQGLGPLKNM